MFGGADTSGTTLMHGSFHILTQPKVYSRLKEELREAWPSLEQPPQLAKLEELPYLVSFAALLTKPFSTPDVRASDCGH